MPRRYNFQEAENTRLNGHLWSPKKLIWLYTKKHLSSGEFCLYLYLCGIALFDRRNANRGVCEFKPRAISHNLGISSNTVYRQLRKLVSLELIEKIETVEGDGYLINNYYQMFEASNSTDFLPECIRDDTTILE